MKQSFNQLLVNLKDTVADYRYYTDFPKVFQKIEKVKIELNILNTLIGSKNIESEFINIITAYPNTIKAVPILLAVRKKNNVIPVIDEKLINFDFKNKSMSDEEYIKFMRESGLFYLLENSKVNNLIDYVTGVEVGLDTNARKNRTGTTMENIVEEFIKPIGFNYTKETTKEYIKENYDINLDAYLVSEESKKIAEKRFDFVIKTDENLYVIETNFYSSSGSKLNETARSFKSLSLDMKDNPKVTFIWITDGVGWKSAKNNLKETYDVMEHLYTLFDLESGILSQIIK